ncbi:MAG: DUF368 domain-containing protein [Bacteroidota bacterium]
MKFRFDVLFKGMAMGAADVVPGVSGGTIAFISGIYEELLDSIKAVNIAAFRTLFREGFSAFWKQINGSFLLPLFLGILISLRSLAEVIKFLLRDHPILLWSFFLGLIIASVVFVARQIPKWNASSVIFLLIGTGVAYWITVISPAQGPTALWFVFVSGVIAICAMILPGISGSFLLLLMGMYGTIIGAVTDRNILILGVFAAGALVGLASFARILSWTFKRYEAPTLAILTGFMIGSLNKVWPWKHTLETRINRHGEEVPFLQENTLPWNHEVVTGQDPQTLFAVLCVILGFALVFFLERWGKQQKIK